MNRLSDERGAVMVLVAGFLPVAIVIATFVIDVGNWWVHKRHLQIQADAAALAGAGAYRTPCDDAAIRAMALQYSGAPYPSSGSPAKHNAQLGGTSAEEIHMELNSPTFYDQTKGDPPGEEPGGTPCATSVVDVKMTETNLPWFLRALNVDYINAQARVGLRRMAAGSKIAPVGVQDSTPKKAKVTFVDEASGAVLGSRELTASGQSQGGLAIWTNAGNPLPLDVSAARIGVRVALSGTDSLTCGDPLVRCFDAGSANGLSFIRGWSATPVVDAGAPPRLRSAYLTPGTCANGAFNAVVVTCTVGLTARVDFAPGVDVSLSRLTATIQGSNQSYALAYSSATDSWSSAAELPVSPGAGPLNVSLAWEQRSGAIGTATCTNTGSNPAACKGDFGVVQRTFSASEARSGPIKLMEVSDQFGPAVDSVEQCSSAQPVCRHDFVVRIGIANALALDGPSDPGRVLRFGTASGSLNGALDCDPAVVRLEDEMAGRDANGNFTGCQPEYTRNSGQACPATANALWATPQPWTCVAVDTGDRTNQLAAGLNLRILGTEQPNGTTGCTNRNNWPAYTADDPRILPMFIVPYGAFDFSGGGTVPVTDFAYFYVTGWKGQGGGFANPCIGQGDEVVAGERQAYIVGHFIKYVGPNDGGGDDPCDFNSISGCVAVMTR